MRLLFVKLKHIGDSLLLTPTLTAVRSTYPQAQIWVVTRKGCDGILAGCPAIDRIVTSAAPETHLRSPLNGLAIFRLLRELRQQKFDYVFELTDGDRGRWISALSGARNRCVNIAGRPLNRWWRGRFNRTSSFAWVNHHRVEKDFFTVHDCLPLAGPVPPLSFDRARAVVPVLGQSGRSYAVFHPGTRWLRKRWPQEKWVDLGRRLLAQFPQLVISAGPDPEEIACARELQAALGPAAISTEGRLSWSEVAGLLYQAKLFVGVDTAAMHLAAACQCPTVAIFGPSVERFWRPWQVDSRVVTARPSPLDPGAAGCLSPIEDRKTGDVTVADVLEASLELLATPLAVQTARGKSTS